jgi:hypothetical protein
MKTLGMVRESGNLIHRRGLGKAAVRQKQSRAQGAKAAKKKFPS